MLDFKLIGSNIREHRTQAGLTQEKLSELLLVTPDYVSKLERGLRKPSLSVIERLGEIFEVDVYTLMCEPEADALEDIDIELYEKIKDWEPETKRMLFKTSDALTDINKTVKKSKK